MTKGAMASNREIRPTCFYWDAREATSWEIIFLLHTWRSNWRSNIKTEIRGVNTGKLFPAILQSYFSYLFLQFFIIFWGFPVGRICSAPTTKNLRKTKLQKTGVNVTIVDTFYQYPYTASAVICKNPESANITKQYNIQQNLIAEISKNNFLKKQM